MLASKRRRVNASVFIVGSPLRAESPARRHRWSNGAELAIKSVEGLLCGLCGDQALLRGGDSRWQTSKLFDAFVLADTIVI